MPMPLKKDAMHNWVKYTLYFGKLARPCLGEGSMEPSLLAYVIC